MWGRAKEGAAILGDFGAYVKLVLLPQMGGYVAKVGVIIVFLAAYGIPVSFGSVMSVLGSNQLANLLSLTPGGVGVNQAFNTFALDSYTDSTTATAYSVGPAAHHDRVQHRLRDPPHLHRLRLERRLGARQDLVRRREGEGLGDERGAAGEEGARSSRRVSPRRGPVSCGRFRRPSGDEDGEPPG